MSIRTEFGNQGEAPGRMETIRASLRLRGPVLPVDEKKCPFRVNPTARPRKNWANTLMDLAYLIADDRSEDSWVQVGAAILKKDNQIVLGYNGAPPGVEIDWSNREERRKRVIHAEENALNMVLPGEGKLMAVKYLPCDKCIRTIALKKIKNVVYGEILPINYDNDLTFQLAKEFGINLTQI